MGFEDRVSAAEARLSRESLSRRVHEEEQSRRALVLGAEVVSFLSRRGLPRISLRQSGVEGQRFIPGHSSQGLYGNRWNPDRYVDNRVHHKIGEGWHVYTSGFYDGQFVPMIHRGIGTDGSLVALKDTSWPMKPPAGEVIKPTDRMIDSYLGDTAAVEELESDWFAGVIEELVRTRVPPRK